MFGNFHTLRLERIISLRISSHTHANDHEIEDIACKLTILLHNIHTLLAIEASDW